MDPARYIENVRLIVEEASSPQPSLAAQGAKRELSRLHQNFPSILKHIAIQSPMVAEQDPERLALAYSDAAVREITATGKDRLTDIDKIYAINNSVRSVTVQEAASYMLHLRDPKCDTDNFLGLSNAYRKSIADPGSLAIRALEKSGIDMHAFSKNLSNADLKAIATSQFHRVDPNNQEKVNDLLRVPGNDAYTKQYGEKTLGNDYGPIIKHQPRHVRTEPVRSRQPSFGQRMAETNISQASTAGR